MHVKQYSMAPDCPVCGLKDREGEWLGARMSSSRWGHSFPCCSDKCGMAFKESSARYAAELQAVEYQISGLKQRASELRSKLLTAQRKENK